LGGELGDAIHRVACRALVPRREGERSRDPRDVVRVGAVLHLGLEALALIPEGPEDRGRAVWEREWTGEDLDDRAAARHSDRLDLLGRRLTHRGAAVPRGRRAAGAHDPEVGFHAELLV